MLFGQKGFLKALDKIVAAIENESMNDEQAGRALSIAIDKACRRNMFGGAAAAVTGILAGLGIQELRRRRLQKKIDET